MGKIIMVKKRSKFDELNMLKNEFDELQELKQDFVQ